MFRFLKKLVKFTVYSFGILFILGIGIAMFAEAPTPEQKAAQAAAQATKAAEAKKLDEIQQKLKAEKVAAQRAYDAKAAEFMATVLQTEKAVKDAAYMPDRPLSFVIGMISDGTRRDGYASYVCQLLAEQGLVRERTYVEVIDVVMASRQKGWVRMGNMNCNTYQSDFNNDQPYS